MWHVSLFFGMMGPMGDRDSDEVDLDLLLQSLGREVRAWRIKRGLSRADLGAMSDVTEKQVGKIERGERGQLEEVWRIADALDVSFSAMVREAEVEARRRAI